MGGCFFLVWLSGLPVLKCSSSSIEAMSESRKMTRLVSSSGYGSGSSASLDER